MGQVYRSLCLHGRHRRRWLPADNRLHKILTQSTKIAGIFTLAIGQATPERTTLCIPANIHIKHWRSVHSTNIITRIIGQEKVETMDKVNDFKPAVTAAVAPLTSLWGSVRLACKKCRLYAYGGDYSPARSSNVPRKWRSSKRHETAFSPRSGLSKVVVMVLAATSRRGVLGTAAAPPFCARPAAAGNATPPESKPRNAVAAPAHHQKCRNASDGEVMPVRARRGIKVRGGE